MLVDRPDPVVRVLATLVTIAYFMMWGGLILALVGLPIAKMTAGDDSDLKIALAAMELRPQALGMDSAMTVRTRWGPAELDLEDARADLEVPIARLSWVIVGLTWIHVAIGASLMLFVLHQLRRIFQRVRDGAPFDADNALRLRWLGESLLALVVFTAVADFFKSLVLRGSIEAGGVAAPAGFDIDTSTLFVAFVLIALAEVFRRGTELERERALVI